MSRLRYQIFIGKDSKDGSRIQYYFEDTFVETKKDETFMVGRRMLYKDNGFVTYENAHDAIVFCNWLNDEENRKHK